ncbi:MAG: hypothetical protein ABR551_00100 [Gemmatimonadales bacterium]
MMHRPDRALARLAVTLVLLLAACAGNTRPNTSAGPTCLGQIRLTVTNDWNLPVEIHRADGASATPTLIGFVSAGGRQEFLLPVGVRSVYTLASEGGMSRPIPRQYRRLVRYRYECEPVR